MYSTKVLLPVAALAGASLAQSFTDPACSETMSSLIRNAPTIAPALSSYIEGPLFHGVQTGSAATTTLPPDTLANPEGYVELLCNVAGELPSSLLPDFQSWGSELLSYGSAHISLYDAFVTHCVTTGEAAATITSYLNSILTGTGGLCKPTATPGSASNGTIPTTPAPTATGTNSIPSNSTTAVLTAAAAKPTGVLVGAAAMGGIIGAVALL
ncbi:hypothetical protein HD806DRAFT_517493 [Xylariaceae sp. AK1471]|nr:hypothetical protein HD806DRAFT_517493 [Xylariaceae sp. AK1471]